MLILSASIASVFSEAGSFDVRLINLVIWSVRKAEAALVLPLLTFNYLVILQAVLHL